MFLPPGAADQPLSQRYLANVDVAVARPVVAAYDRTFADLDPLLRATFGTVPVVARSLGDDMNTRSANFIAGRAPDFAGATPWPRFDGTQIMRFSPDGAVHGTLDRRQVALWAGVSF